jgi:hypothetical protein
MTEGSLYEVTYRRVRNADWLTIARRWAPRWWAPPGSTPTERPSARSASDARPMCRNVRAVSQ